MAHEIDYYALLEDPRPDLPDTNLWRKLFRAIVDLEDKETAELLQRRLWTLRSIGAQLKYIAGVWRFAPILDETGGYESEAEFEKDKREYLLPYAKDIADLLDKVTGNE